MREYSETKLLKSCKISKSDLIKLIELITNGFPLTDRKADFTLKANYEITSITEYSLEELLKNNDIPAILSDLSINQIGWDDKREHKNISVYISTQFVFLSVSGFDEAWVHGKFEIIEKFIKSKQRKLVYLFYTLPLIGGGLLGSVILPSIFDLIKNKDIDIILFASGLLMFVLLFIVFFTSSFSKTQIITTDLPLKSDNNAFNSLMINILLLVFTIITFIYTFVI